jgi:hypothetical protein
MQVGLPENKNYIIFIHYEYISDFKLWSHEKSNYIH